MSFRKSDNAADLLGSIISSENGKVQKCLLERKRKEKEFLDKKESIKRKTIMAPKLNQMFVKNKNDEDKLINETVGLKTVYEYKKIKDEIFNKTKKIEEEKDVGKKEIKKTKSFKFTFELDDDDEEQYEQQKQQLQQQQKQQQQQQKQKQQQQHHKQQPQQQQHHKQQPQQQQKKQQQQQQQQQQQKHRQDKGKEEEKEKGCLGKKEKENREQTNTPRKCGIKENCEKREDMEKEYMDPGKEVKKEVQKEVQKEEKDKNINKQFKRVEKPMFKKMMKDPTANTSFLKDKERDRLIELKKRELKELYYKLENQEKEQMIEITYSYYDGAGHRRKILVKKKTTIGQFINKCVDKLKREFFNLRSASCETLMFVKEDVILPNYLTFYELIKNKAQGKTGPLFCFDAVENLTGVTDIRQGKTDTHAGKLVEKRWYERNKHIFPASKWELYKPDKNYSHSYKDLFNDANQ